MKAGQDIGPRALLGGPLEGSAPVRMIYVDEAGTSAREPVVVVVGVIVHADLQWRAAREAMARVLLQVPPKFRENFIFHAAEIWGSRKYRPDWSREDRFRFLCDVMSIPRNIGLSIGYGVVYKKRVLGTADFPIDADKQAHMVAFMSCIESIDMFMQEQAFPMEVGTVVAEDVPEMRKWLRTAVEILKTGRLPLDTTMRTVAVSQGTVSETPLKGFSQIARLVDVTHFAAKHEAPLLQIADACAFALRRFWAEQSTGDDFLTAMLGTSSTHSLLRDFSTVATSGVLPMIPAYLMRPDVPPLPPVNGPKISYSVDFGKLI